MASIDIDEQTARSLAARAAARGISVNEFLRQLLLAGDPPAGQKLQAAELEELIEAELTEAPILPDDFARADIYAEHD